MKTTPIRRVFKFGGRTLPDPNPKLEPEQVRGVLAATHPEIASAVLQGPSYDKGREEYEFVTAVGTKG